MVKNLPAMWEIWDSIPGSGRSPGGGQGNPLQYSCLENPHGQRSLVGYRPWGSKGSDMTETKHCTTRLGVLKSEMVWGRERACGQSTKSFCL